MAKPSSVQQFGENFLKVIENDRALREQRRQFDQEISFRERQLKLDDSRKQQYYDLQNQINQRQAGEFFLENFAPTETLGTGIPNEKLGTFDYGDGQSTPMFSDTDIEQTLGGGVDFPQGQYIRPNLIPEPPKPEPLFDITETLVDEKGQPQVYGISKITGDKTPLGVNYSELTGRINANTSKTSQLKPYTENELKEWEKRSMDYLKNPIFSEVRKIDGEEQLVELTPEEVKVDLDDSINGLMAVDLDSNTTRWFNDITAQYGRYPTPEELQKEIVEGGKGGEITPDEGERLAAFLNRYYGVFGGVDDSQRRILGYGVSEMNRSKRSKEIKDELFQNNFNPMNNFGF